MHELFPIGLQYLDFPATAILKLWNLRYRTFYRIDNAMDFVVLRKCREKNKVASGGITAAVWRNENVGHDEARKPNLVG